MAQPAPKPTDRLPWLTEVPRSAPPPAKPRRSFPWGWVGGAAAFVAVGAGSYWLGTRQDGPEPTQVAEVAAPPAADPLGQLPDQPVTAEDLGALKEVLPVEETLPQPEAERPLPQPAPQRAAPAAPEPAAETDADAEENMVTPAPVPAPAVRPAVRGRLVQLGAYTTALEANAAWRQAVQSWPYLASKPRVITPIEVRSTDGKATRMFRLQLATSSQAQATVICQRLEEAQQSCTVVY